MPPRISSATAIINFPAPSPRTHCRSCLRRAFSSTPKEQTRLRRHMFAWLHGPGENFRHPLPNSTNYLSAYDRSGKLLRGSAKSSDTPSSANETEDSKALRNAAVEDDLEKESRQDLKPFPLNNHFISQSVLSESLRHEVWKRVQIDKKSVRQVSVELGIEMRRIGAVVRLVEVEKRMQKEGKTLALPYARAIHSMIPVTPYNPENPQAVTPHESINDLPQHPLTNSQLFYPTSESRAFNRVDAGRVFSAAPRLPDAQDIGQGGKPLQEPWKDTKREIIGRKGHETEVLKAADSRIPHPHLVAFEQDKRNPAFANERSQRLERYYGRLSDDAAQRQAAKEKKVAREEAKKKRIQSERWEFIVTEVQATRTGSGLDGRGTKNPGHRYGVPSQDRKKGQIKIPTKVDV